MRFRRSSLLACATGALLIAGSGVASATLTQNTANCGGSAVITNPEGVVYRVDATIARATIPREGVVQWQGHANPLSGYSGAVKVVIGPLSVPLGSWSGGLSKAASSGVKEIPKAFKSVPPGLYRVSGFHSGAGGRCEGSILLEIEGSPLSTPVGAGVVGATAVAALATVGAGLARKKVGV